MRHINDMFTNSMLTKKHVIHKRHVKKQHMMHKRHVNKQHVDKKNMFFRTAKNYKS